MIDIAENSLVRIAEQLLKKGLTVRKVYGDMITEDEIEGMTIELLSPLAFVEGLKRLELDGEFSDVEVTCLMNVLAKPQLDNAILVEELLTIMENFGIGDDEPAEESQEPTGKEEAAEGSGKKPRKKKGVDLDQLEDEGFMLLYRLTEHLLQKKDGSFYELFEGFVYEQLVKTKTKQSVVEIINKDDFISVLVKLGLSPTNPFSP